MLQRVRRGGIRPISIGRALLAHLDAQFDELGSSDGLTPKFVISLHPDDVAKLSVFESALLEELHNAVIHHAAIEGYTLIGDVEIRLITEPSVKHGACVVNPLERSIPESTPLIAQPNAENRSTTATPIVTKAEIVLGSGERISLTGDLATVGRQSDCQIVIDDHNVSRTHAEIRRTSNGWVVTDRGSTNGTKVNGEKIVAGRLLVNGDTIAFGSTPVRFENS